MIDILLHVCELHQNTDRCKAKKNTKKRIIQENTKNKNNLIHNKHNEIIFCYEILNGL